MIAPADVYDHARNIGMVVKLRQAVVWPLRNVGAVPAAAGRHAVAQSTTRDKGA